MPGDPGNVVVAGHRVSHSRPFRYIDRLSSGDEVVFTVDGRRSVYVVTGHEIVTPNRVDIVNPTETATATLFACEPPGSTRYRYVVYLALSASA
jgi:sortase A